MGSKMSRSLYNDKNRSIYQEKFAEELNPIIGENQNTYFSAFSSHPSSNISNDIKDGNTVSSGGDSKITPEVNLTDFKVNESPEKNSKMEEEIKKTNERIALIDSRTNEMNKNTSDVNLINYKVNESLEMSRKTREENETIKEKLTSSDFATQTILLNIKNLSDKIDQGFINVNQRIEKVDQRIDRESKDVKERFDRVDQRIEKVDQRINDVDGRLYSLNTCLIGGFFIIISSSIFLRPFQRMLFQKKRIRNNLKSVS